MHQEQSQSSHLPPDPQMAPPGPSSSGSVVTHSPNPPLCLVSNAIGCFALGFGFRLCFFQANSDEDITVRPWSSSLCYAAAKPGHVSGAQHCSHPHAQPGCPGSAPTGTAAWINTGFSLDEEQKFLRILASTSSKAETGASYRLCACFGRTQLAPCRPGWQDGHQWEEPAHTLSSELAQAAHAACSSPRSYPEATVTHWLPSAALHPHRGAQRALHGHVQTRAAAPMRSKTLTKMEKQTTLHEPASLRG